MAVTVKKKKLTVKTVRAKKTPAGEAPPADATTPVEGAGQAPDAAAAEVATPPADAAAPAAKPASYTFAGVLAIIMFLSFTALIILQYMEWDFFRDAFPKPNMAIPGAPAVYTPTAVPEAAPIEEVTDTPAPAEDAPTE